MKTPTIGLFGTCGGSSWRDPFKATYDQHGIAYFDPQVDDWKPEDAVREAEHLATDEIILFPILGETYAEGSLAECGFSILNAIRLDDRRDFVVLVDMELAPNLRDPDRRKASLRARALVLQHLRALRLGNVYVAENLEQMLGLSLALYTVAKTRAGIAHLNPHAARPAA